MLLSIEEKIEIVLLARTNTYRSTVDIFNQRHPDRPAPLHPRTVAALFQKLKKYGTLERKKRTISARTSELKATLTSHIKRIYQEDEHISTRKVAARVGKSHMTVWKTLKQEKFFPYKMARAQKLRPNDPPTRKQFCVDLKNIFDQDPNFYKKILWTDEKLFRTSGCFNRQTHRYWAQENPRWERQMKEVGGESVMVWTGIINTHIIGPYFFTDTVNSDSYLDMIYNFLLPELHRLGYDSIQVCYMHDGAPAHYTQEVRDCLDEQFECWIGRGEGTNRLLAWPPRSPDLNMLDFYLWGYLNHKVHMTQNNSADDIRRKLNEIIPLISVETLDRVQRNLVKRLRLCASLNGSTFENLLKKKRSETEEESGAANPL